MRVCLHFYDASCIPISRTDGATFVTADERLHAKLREKSRTAVLSKWPIRSRETRPRKKREDR